MKNLKKMLAMLLAMAMVFALASCGSGDSNQDQPNDQSNAGTVGQTHSGENDASGAEGSAAAAKTEITAGWLGTNNIVNPFDPVMGFGFAMCGGTQTFLVYDQMFYADNNGVYQSRIFDSWEWADDTTLVCHLKDNIYFSNGDQLTGEDIIYTFQLMQEGFFPIKFMYGFVDVAGSYTEDNGLTLYLKTFEVTPSAIPFMYLGILDKDYIESVGGENIDWFDPAQCVGSGPYKPVEFVQDGYSVYELRDDYWGYAYGYEQTIEKLTVQLYGDATSMMADYANGVIDLAWGVTNSDYEAVMNGEYGNSGAGIAGSL